MEMIFIYGPPAVGKMAVAKELSELTGFRYFINHQASDPVRSILDFEKDPSKFRRVANKVKLLILEEAVDAQIPGLIMTFCYSRPDADQNLYALMAPLKKRGININFARLYCDEGELYRRVQDPSRKLNDVKKLTDPEELREALRKHNFREEISYVKSLSIDNTFLSPEETAIRIAQNFEFHSYGDKSIYSGK